MSHHRSVGESARRRSHREDEMPNRTPAVAENVARPAAEQQGDHRKFREVRRDNPSSRNLKSRASAGYWAGRRSRSSCRPADISVGTEMTGASAKPGFQCVLGRCPAWRLCHKRHRAASPRFRDTRAAPAGHLPSGFLGQHPDELHAVGQKQFSPPLERQVGMYLPKGDHRKDGTTTAHTCFPPGTSGSGNRPGPPR